LTACSPPKEWVNPFTSKSAMGYFPSER
jgi:hypothetical protein